MTIVSSTATDWDVELASIELPRFDLPREYPTIPADVRKTRLSRFEAAAIERGLDAVLIYGDREHFANTSYLTGFDPRYEESLLIVVPGRTPRFLVGNESVAYASITPYPIDIIRFSKFSLVGQPDPEDYALGDLLREAGLGETEIRRVGLVGWKYFVGSSASDYIDVPHFIVEEVQRLVDVVENATDLLIHPDYGLRIDNDVHQLAQFEFAASHGSEAMLRLLHGVQPGMTELEASALMQPIMLPFSYHPTMLGGREHTAWGVASPTSRVLERGTPVCAGIGYWGSNTARAGFLVHDAEELPAGVGDYVEKLVAPYYATAAAWYETLRIGLTAGELYEVTASRIGDDWYGVYLNPGHFIHLDEWPASPVKKESTTVFRSGNAIQLDIIPGTGTEYHTSQIEDGVLLADEQLRVQIRELYPEMWQRAQARRDMLADVFGITLHEEVLPLSNTAGYLPPYWLAPNLAMRRLRAGK
ncbi:hypothetical protein GTZ78_06810 [Streptomyces sp. SID8361]|uniref:aminopeptidase P family N-terminal domain-containing protein n=1 Tax=Streptomyces sp. MnatMP-M27 TaxID=1839768 RepID=UPI00081D71FF|nr:aminopeptidase P family N-terminal domain-containing protein [Streptomyces sp. MnatMP-M27]MYU10408.1 hypothetical protein [Streptomyces sp. SID8361]SCF71671.1 Xaa-Pro aminopeptidase [Streptomyces sp. MnatMP-M27]